MKTIILAIAIALTLLVSACTTQTSGEAMVKTDNSVIETPKEDTMMENKSEPAIETPQNAMMAEYSGMLLAGKTTQYLEFNQADYEKANAEGKLVVLYFYASWCPSCKAEQPIAFAAFDALDNSDVVGFRVKYKDFESEYEKNLAKQFGVPYQHTKVFVRDGEMLLKSPESWDEERYLAEIAKYS